MNKITVAHVNLAKGFRGGERQTELLISHLASFGVKQILLCRQGSVLVEHLKSINELEIIELKKRVDIRFSGHLLLGKKCDIVQAHEARAAQWAFIHYLMYGVPYVVTRRVPEAVRNNFFNRMIYRKSIRVVAISKSIAEYLKREFNIEVEVIADSSANFEIDLQFVSDLKRKYSNCYIIGHAGALVDKHKGQSTLIKAVNLIRERIPNVKIFFLGKGQDEEKLKSLSKDLIDQNIIVFHGFVENIGDYIAVMDVFAYPSNYEGLGSVLLDVMAQGVPIVASDVDGIPDIVKDGYSGLLVQKGDSTELAEAIIKIASSRQLREQLICGGKQVANEHNPQHIAALYADLYEMAMKR